MAVSPGCCGNNAPGHGSGGGEEEAHASLVGWKQEHIDVFPARRDSRGRECLRDPEARNPFMKQVPMLDAELLEAVHPSLQ